MNCLLLQWGVGGGVTGWVLHRSSMHLLEAELLTSITKPCGGTAAMTNNAGIGMPIAYKTQA